MVFAKKVPRSCYFASFGSEINSFAKDDDDDDDDENNVGKEISDSSFKSSVFPSTVNLEILWRLLHATEIQCWL